MRKNFTGNTFILQHVAAAAFIFSLLVYDASAASVAPVQDGWFRSLPGNLPAGGYFLLHNGGSKPLVLAGASSPACGAIMLHESKSMSGMADMMDVSRVTVPPGGAVSFAPGGYHLMCMGPKMKIGTRVPVTLHFDGAADIHADFAVRGATGR